MPSTFKTQMLICLTSGFLLSSGCVSTVIGVTTDAAVAVTSAVITAPIKIGVAVVDAVVDDEDEDEEN